MNAVVLMKQVPNAAKVKIDPKTGSLIRAGVESMINPDDRRALEAAVRLAGKPGSGAVVALTMGPPQAIDVLTEALALGADRGVLLTDPLFAGADTWATSTVLARAIEFIGDYDVILAGRQAVDGDTAQIGPQTAEALNIPQATCVQKLSRTCDRIRVERKVDGGVEVLELKPPCLLTVTAEVNVPRLPDVGRLLAGCAPAAPIQTLNAADLGLTADQVGLAGSLTRVIRTFSPRQARKGDRLDGGPADMADQLLDRLHAVGLGLGR